MRRIYQVYTGAGHGRTINAQQVINVLSGELTPTDLIIGWSQNTDLYRELRKYAKSAGIRLWLWFPVFSEHTYELGLKPMEAVNGRSIPHTDFDGDERFDFCCPCDGGLVERLLGLYDKVFSDVGFDGVFLDRLRHLSMSAGLEALFGCCCSSCMEWYAEHGINEAEIRGLYESLRGRVRNPDDNNPLTLESYIGGETHFKDDGLERFIRLKTITIANSLSPLVEGFRSRGLKIGMDLFAPFLSNFVGQDYTELAKKADFVKPMLYRLTWTPAGMGWELEAIARAVSGTEQMYFDRLEWLKEFYGVKDNCLNLFSSELNMLKHMEEVLARRGLFIPGIDIHTAPGLPVLPEDEIRRSVEAAERAGFEGRAACWNVLASSRNAMMAFLNRRE